MRDQAAYRNHYAKFNLGHGEPRIIAGINLFESASDYCIEVYTLPGQKFVIIDLPRLS